MLRTFPLLLHLKYFLFILQKRDCVYGIEIQSRIWDTLFVYPRSLYDLALFRKRILIILSSFLYDVARRRKKRRNIKSRSPSSDIFTNGGTRFSKSKESGQAFRSNTCIPYGPASAPKCVFRRRPSRRHMHSDKTETVVSRFLRRKDYYANTHEK